MSFVMSFVGAPVSLLPDIACSELSLHKHNQTLQIIKHLTHKLGLLTRGRSKMHFSFSAVNEKADENEISCSAEKKTKTKVIRAYITELSYGSVASRTF